jgi:GDP-L-fucose synthase
MLSQEIKDYLKGKNCLVTGGTGLIGRQVVDLLVDCEAAVTSVSLDSLTLNKHANYGVVDLSDYKFIRSLIKSMDLVLHVAGIKGSIEVTKTKPASFFVPLLQMNTNVLEACRSCGIKRMVYVSSVGAYQSAEIFKEKDCDFSKPPMDEFPGWAKRMAELQIQAYKKQYGIVDYAIVRPANIYGPGDNFDSKNAMVIPSLMARLVDGENPLVVWGDGSAVRDFAYSKDIAEGIIRALYYGTDGEVVNLGSGKGVTIRELVETLAEVCKDDLSFDIKFDEAKPSGFPKRVMDITRAQQWFGWEPTTSLKDGLKETWDWFLDHGEESLKRTDYFNEQATS